MLQSRIRRITSFFLFPKVNMCCCPRATPQRGMACIDGRWVSTPSTLPRSAYPRHWTRRCPSRRSTSPNCARPAARARVPRCRRRILVDGAVCGCRWLRLRSRLRKTWCSRGSHSVWGNVGSVVYDEGVKGRGKVREDADYGKRKIGSSGRKRNTYAYSTRRRSWQTHQQKSRLHVKGRACILYMPRHPGYISHQ